MNNLYLFPPMFPIPPITYTSAPGGLQIGKFPNPRNVSQIGNNKEAQSFLSRGGQVIIRMRGLPYDCTAKQVVRSGNLILQRVTLSSCQSSLCASRPNSSRVERVVVMFWTRKTASCLFGNPTAEPRVMPLFFSLKRRMPKKPYRSIKKSLDHDILSSSDQPQPK